MSIDKTTLNRIRIAIQHALCSCVEDNDDDVNYESMAKAAVDLGIIEKEEDFDGETFTHAPILFEKIWERIGDDLYKTPLELFEAWVEDDMSIYRLGEEIEDWSEVQLACSMLQVMLSGRNPITNFVFIGKDFVKLYKDRSIQDLNEMQCEAFELMRDYIIRKEAGHLGLKMAARLFGRKKEEKEDEDFTTKKGRKFIKLYDPETGEYLSPLVKPMTHEEAHGKKEPVDDIKVNFNKEAWDKLKYEHDIDGDHFKLAEAALFNPDKGVLEVILENDNDVEKLVDLLNSFSELPKDIGEGTKNSAEIFCRATDGSYKDFEQYSAEFCAFTPIESLNLPYVVDESIRKVSRISELAEIEINTPLLVYSVYKSRYEPAKYPYGATDVIFDIVDSMLELKKEGTIQ
nr:MAG TPA: hypothetical protein [Caudoviricetes sp.]